MVRISLILIPRVNPTCESFRPWPIPFRSSSSRDHRTNPCDYASITSTIVCSKSLSRHTRSRHFNRSVARGVTMMIFRALNKFNRCSRSSSIRERGGWKGEGVSGSSVRSSLGIYNGRYNSVSDSRGYLARRGRRRRISRRRNSSRKNRTRVDF